MLYPISWDCTSLVPNTPARWNIFPAFKLSSLIQMLYILITLSFNEYKLTWCNLSSLNSITIPGFPLHFLYIRYMLLYGRSAKLHAILPSVISLRLYITAIRHCSCTQSLLQWMPTYIWLINYLLHLHLWF